MIAQRTKDGPLFGIFHWGRFSAPGVRCPAVHFQDVLGIDLQGCGLRRAFVVLHQRGIDHDGDLVDLMCLLGQVGWCCCKRSDTRLDIGSSRDPFLLQWLDGTSS